MADLPADTLYGTVVGQYIRAVIDSADPERDPDGEPMQGTITFRPDLTRQARAEAPPNPVTMYLEPVTVELDDEGYIVGPDGTQGIVLVASDSPGNPTNFTWTALVKLVGADPECYSFYLPAGETVDLTLVAPVAVYNGTPIVVGPEGPEGPEGPPGAFDASIIDAKGDLLVGSGPDAFDILPVGPEGTALTPDPGAPLGLSWKPVAPPEAGIKVYASVAEAEAVVTAEVGILHVDNIAEAFPSLAVNVDTPWSSQEPGSFVIITNAASEDTSSDGWTVIQEMVIADGWYGERWPARRIYTVGSTTSDWGLAPELPDPGNNDGTVPFAENYRYVPKRAASISQINSLVLRDDRGRAQIKNPSAPEDIVNKQTLDDAISAIPPASGGVPVYTTEAELQAAPFGWVVADIAATPDWPTIGERVGEGRYPVRVTGELFDGWGSKELEIFINSTSVMLWTGGVETQNGPFVWGDPSWMPYPLTDPGGVNTSYSTYLLSRSPLGNPPDQWMRTYSEADPYPEGGPGNVPAIPKYGYSGTLYAADPRLPQDVATKNYVDSQGGNILTGPVPPLDAEGSPGDFYIDTTTGTMYGPKNGPYTHEPFLLWGGAPASEVTYSDAKGVKFTVNVPGRITGVRMFQGPNQYDNQVTLWGADVYTQLASGNAPTAALGTFAEVPFSEPVDVAAGEYHVSYSGYESEPYSPSGLPLAGAHVTLVTAMKGSYYATDTDPGNFWIEPIFELPTTVWWPVAIPGSAALITAAVAALRAELGLP